jgi:cytochrome c2
LKPFFRFLTPAAVSVFGASFLVWAAVAQAPASRGDETAHHGHFHPAPTNLKVLPKTLTGDQVHDIMEGWAGSLGVHCNTCHTADPNKIGPNGRPRLNFADDSKPEKSTARLMYTMTRDINENYVSMVPVKAGAPAATVTCGTCHRGQKKPEPFVIPPEHEGEDSAHDPAPAGTKPSQSR